MVKDLTQGKPMRIIIGFAIPLLLGMLFQQFYSLVDTVIVGKTLGVDALAAVGSTGSINFLIIGFCMGACAGFTIPIAQRFGAKDYDSMRKYVANSVWISAIFAVVMTIVTVTLCRSILIWMRTPENILDGAYLYIVVIFAGIPVTYLYNLLSGIIRSLGDSKTPVYFLVLSSILNIALDFAFILGLHTGVEGAAYATVISQGASGILCLFYMRKKYEILKMSKYDWKFDGHIAGILCGMGVPMGLQYSITAIGSVILQSAVNTLGSSVVAAVTAAGKINGFLACPFDAMGSTMATYGGQNVGAKRLDRVSQGLKSCVILGVGYSVIALGIVFLFATPLELMFLDASEVEIMAQARIFLIINVCFFIPLALVNIVRFLIQGMGFPKFAVFAGVFEMIARAFVGFFLVPVFGFMAACFASPAAWILADCFLIPADISCHKKLGRICAPAVGSSGEMR